MERHWAAEAGLVLSAKQLSNIPEIWIAHPDRSDYLQYSTGVAWREKGEDCRGLWCRRCIDARPEGALYAPFRLDARKCISYHTIESHELYSARPVEYKGQIFGCEICLRACPYDRESEGWKELRTNAEEIVSKSPQDWQDMDEKEFKERFGDTPLSRAGLDKIKNNL